MNIKFIKVKGTNTNVIFNGKKYSSIARFEHANGLRQGIIHQEILRKKISYEEAATKLLKKDRNNKIDLFIYKMKPVYSRFINA